MPRTEEPTISTFAELFEHIAYDWGFDKTGLNKDKDGFWVNKTYITPTELSYKTERYKITNEAVFKKLEIFYGLLQTTETERVLFEE